MIIHINISDSGSAALFSVQLPGGKISKIKSSGGMPVERLAARCRWGKCGKNWARLKRELERAWNCDNEDESDPYEAQITDDDGNILA